MNHVSTFAGCAIRAEALRLKLYLPGRDGGITIRRTAQAVSIQGTPSYVSCLDVRLLRDAGDLAGAM